MFKVLSLSSTIAITIIFICYCSIHAQVSVQNSAGSFAAESAVDSVVTILLANEGRSNAVGSGLIVHQNGYILAPYHLVKGAREIQIRLRNGEIFDKAEIVSTDERRNIAILHINAAGLRVIPTGTVEEAEVGSHLFIVANPRGQSWIDKDKVLNAVQLADSIQGAGRGFRILQFDAIANDNPTGALILDERGRSLGIITTNPEIRNQNIAVPLSSILGLIRSSYSNTPLVSSTPFVSSSTYIPSSP